MPRFESFDIVASICSSLHRIAKLQFADDGTIYVFFPGFAHTDGIACRVLLRAAQGGSSNVDLAKDGLLTTHLVKYCHHPDGEAHFSQDRKVKTVVRRKSVPLSEHRGHLFTIQLQDVRSFPRIPSPRKAQLTLEVPENIRALKITCWRFDSSQLTWPDTHPPSESPRGIVTDDGIIRQGLFVSPPQGMPFDDIVLFLAIAEIPRFNKEKNAQLLFLGGFDHHTTAFDLSLDTEFLAFAYPCSDYERLRKCIGSMDFREVKRTPGG